jgi:tetratricopeptide (TPR) repeat protein
MAVANEQKTSSPDIEAYQAMKLLDGGDTQGAVKKCIDAINQFGDNRNCYLVKARAHIEMEEYGFAEEALQGVLRLDPEHPAAWAMLGEVYYRLGIEAKMEYCRSRLETIFPVLKEIIETGGDEDLAIEEEIPETIEEKPEQRDSIVPLEDLDIHDQKPGEGEMRFRKVSDEEIEPESLEVDETTEGPSKTIGLKSEMFETPTFADICLQQGKLEKALGIYKKLLEKDPENAGFNEKVKYIIQRLEENES